MNNNLLNNVNFIGSTHLDYTKISSNFTLATSNILETRIRDTSNVLETHISDAKIYNIAYTNNLRTDVDKWIGEEIEHITLPLPSDLTHTHITNSNLAGEIRFWVKSTSLFPPVIPTGVPDYRTKIDTDGKLKIYYTYDPLINATWGNGWIDVANQLIGAAADSFNQGVLIGGLQVELSVFKNKMENEILTLYQAIWLSVWENNFDNEENVLGALFEYRTNAVNTLTEYETTTLTQEANTLINNTRQAGNISLLGRIGAKVNEYITTSPAVVFAAGTGGTIVGIIYGISQNAAQINYLNSIIRSINDNTHLTTQEKENSIGYIQSNLIASNLVNMAQAYYDTSVAQGFINSNITIPQLIPSIKTDAITLNGYAIENVLLPRAGGTLTGSITIDRSTVATPTVGYFGGTGDRIVFYKGTPTTLPFSIGINTASLWYSVPVNCTHDWYVNGVKTMSLNNNDFILSGGVPNLRLTTTNGNNLGYATANGYFSLSALAGDVVLRANNNLILQSKGGGTAALTIDKTNNYVNINTRLTANSFYYNDLELNVNISNVATGTILSSTPNVSKKYMFQFTCSTSILMPNNITYYKYDIDLRNYTQLKYIPNPNTPYRIFKIKLWMASGYFQYLYQNNKYSVLSYEVYMSNQSQAGGGGMGDTGINIRAFGFPENNDLKSITASQIILVRTPNFNYLSCLSLFNTALVNAVIEDVLF